MVLLETMNFLHSIGIAWGVGGATIATIIMAKSAKNPKAAPYLGSVTRSISKLIMTALILLIVSGIGLIGLVSWPVNPLILGIKHTVIGVLVLNAIILNAKIMPKMKTTKDKKELLKVKKMAKISGITNLILWYTVVVLSVVM